MLNVFVNNFLGKAPRWYKLTILAFLIINPIVFFLVSPFAAGWVLLLEFIFTLALALKCYPVPSGGLLALEAVIIGLASPCAVYNEVADNLPILLLLIFMVAAIFYLKEVIFLAFTKLFIGIKNKQLLCLTFCVMCAALAAFLDALAIMAAIIAVCFNCYAIYHRVAGELNGEDAHAEMEEFKGFLRNFIMHGAIGTVLGGTMTIVGEPHNLMIATKMGWEFGEFFQHCKIISVPVAIAGFVLCPILETVKFPGFGYQLPKRAYDAIVKDYNSKFAQMSAQSLFTYILQAFVAVLLFAALAFHVAEVGLIGIALMVVMSAFKGLTKEHDFAEAFNNAMPFALLIVVFFAVLAVVHEQHLVAPLISWVFQFDGKIQLLALYFANGALSVVSDNVFVASVFINEVEKAYNQGMFAYEWFENLAVVVNMGTNILAVGTPNGHAAFLFLLTSSIAPLINLSFMQMVKLTLPYTIVMTTTGAGCIYFLM
jgi:NhaB family Na+:H+ antiporter